MLHSMSTQTKYSIGIDLGTTYSCVGVWRNDRVEIIANDQGNRIMPSCVAFTRDEKLVGEAAQDQSVWNAKNTVFGIKRMLGRQFNDPKLQEDMKLWPFKVLERDGKPVVEVSFKGETRKFTPEEISTMILIKMKQTAELKLGAIKDAVITVPAYFNNAQRKATKQAGESAGFNVLRILAEPTAAALAYGLDANNAGRKNILVYDLGGGTFDVSLVTIEEDVFKVLATSGDTHLGGEDFDNLLVEHCIKEFRKKNECEIYSNPKSMRRLKAACERAKRKLSSATRASVDIDALYDGIDFNTVLTRTKFEEICGDLFASTITYIPKILEGSNLKKHQIDEVVLSGGSSRIPKVQQLLSHFFDGKKLNKSINLDEAVAMGAAIHAVMIKDNIIQRIKDIQLTDVTPLSLGIKEGFDEKMAVVVPRSTILPATKSEIFTTASDWQNTVSITIYEGESFFVKANTLLGKFTLNNIQIAPQGDPKFEVKFKIDLNGILQVSAVDMLTGSYKDITITNYQNRSAQKKIGATTICYSDIDG